MNPPELPEPGLSEQSLAGLYELARSGPVSVNIVGDCMDPVLRNGETVRVVRRQLYWPGDVVVFPQDNRLRAHRLLGYRPGPSGPLAILRPDASADTWDNPTPPADILGRVTHVSSGTPIDIGLGARMRALGLFVKLAWRKLLRSL